MTTQPVSSTPSSSSSSPYDVFLSFRGKDTRTNFTDHLHEALVRKGIRTFIDGELVRGEEISPALVKAIEESRISLIVFSENYASSRWCLDELVKILQCKQSKQQVVLPIFYKVDPSDVRKQTSKFGDAFEGLIESKFKDNEEKVLIWREALKEAGNLSGHTFKDGEYETTFINNIVDGILSQVLSRTYWNVAKHPVGIHSRVQDVKKLLDVGGNGRRMVGIWGTSGIGKTTIAKAIWNAMAYEFEGRCFLENVRENSMTHGGLIKLQETLLHKILGGEWKIHSVDEGIGVIKELLSHKKILLILDDVNQLKQLDNLAGVGWFGEGSRVITTTQDSGLLKCHGIDLIYGVQKLHGDRALELFSFSAFGTSEPPKDYLELAQRGLKYAQGIPLALTLLGSHLRNKDKDRWQDILDSYEGEPYTGIQKILQKSYDALENSMQQVFLDIACFFKGGAKDYVLQIVSNSKKKVSRDCIEVLIEKAMITIDDGRIQMHDLIEKLGKDIVHEESPNDPSKRSRLWFYEDVKQVLTESTGTRNIQGIMVKLPNPAEIILNPECFCNMINLEIFINRNKYLRGHIKYLPNTLRLIDWDRCQLQSLPPNFQGNRLVKFNMPRSHIRQLDGFNFKQSPNLTTMNLRGCQFLEKIPDLSGIPNIKYLDLSECTRLVEVHGSVGFLDKLVKLDLSGCVELIRFGTTLGLKSLENLDLSDCKSLESFPEIEVKMESLRVLGISGSGIRELPPSIAYLTGLRKLDLRGCFNLTRFATLRLKSLEELDLSDCKSLESFPKIEVKMESLQVLRLSRSGIRELPPSIAYLTGLRLLYLCACFNLTRFATLGLESLKHLQLNDCKSLESLPEIEVEMESLRFLHISGSGVRELPPSIAYLTGLQLLALRGCFNLTRFATLRLKSLQELDLTDCKSLESFPEIEVEMESLRVLRLSGSGIRELPPSIAYLTGLQFLDLSGCFNFTRFATLRLKSLETLYLSDCKSLESFPEIEVEMESLSCLDISRSGIRELPPSIAYLTGLRKLDLRGCFNLTRFATLRLKSLEELDLSYCKSLESFPEIEVEMKSLWVLRLSGSGLRELPPSIAYLTGLQQLYLGGCFNLTILQGFLWSTVTELFLSQSNFVNLPISFSKFVNLRYLYLTNCQSLLEIREQVLPRRIECVVLDNCTSLEKIPELPWKDDHMYLSLKNCVRLRGYDITEHIFLNQVSVSSPHSLFKIILPGDEVPKWFSYCKDATDVVDAMAVDDDIYDDQDQDYETEVYDDQDQDYEYDDEKEVYDSYDCEVSFEIPPNLKWETLRLVLCAVNIDPISLNLDLCSAKILLNGKLVNQINFGSKRSHLNDEDIRLLETRHVYLTSIPLLETRQSNRHAMYGFEEPPTKQVNTCQVIFDLFGQVPAPVKIPCGVHLLGHHVADVSETDVVDHGPTQLLPDAMAVDDDIYDIYHEYLSLYFASKTRQSDYMARRRHW